MAQASIVVEQVIKEYAHFFCMVYGRDPAAHYVRDGWYRINGEFVHHHVLLQQIDNLRHLARRKRMHESNKNAIQRLIEKLRGMHTT